MSGPDDDTSTDDPSPQGRVAAKPPGGDRRKGQSRAHGRPESPLPNALPRALRKRMTPQEVKLWNWLREELAPAGLHFRRQVAISRFVVDFACLKHRVIVEVDGGHHGLHGHAAADRARDEALSKHGFHVLRFSNADVDQNKRMVLDTIYAALTCATPHPSRAIELGLARVRFSKCRSRINPTSARVPPSPAGRDRSAP
ncbi:endonuclease domain-containing protein [Chelatococcus sp. GCM10030263]|uniref:endonuclease domain-containing protein n=1 Tax=Chelatococcus sp. GCM10030263 TaxID=3273387 RepID=UPI00360EF862